MSVKKGVMRLLIVLLLVQCGAAVPCTAAGVYRTVEVASLKIIVDSEWGIKTSPGYFPVRVDITNLGDARVIEIIGEGMRFFRTYALAGTYSPAGPPEGIHVRQAVRLSRGDRVRFTIPVPVSADNENIRFAIQENGETLEQLGYTGFQSRSPAAEASALIVAGRSAFGKVASSWPRSASGTMLIAGGRPGPAPLLDFVLEPERLPTNWLGYTSLRAVILGPTEWRLLDEAQKSAILTWTACGGDLFFVDGEMRALFPGRQDATGSTPDPEVRAYFFGRIHRPTSASVQASGLAAVLSAAEKVQDDNWALPAIRARDWGLIAARGFRLPIPGVNGVPARAYLSILIVFSVLIGPVNYWLLWRRRRQVLFVLTTPLVSAVFIVLLAGYVLAAEGLAVHGRATTFTMIDQVRKQAVTRASMSLYAAGMTPGNGLQFPRDVAVYAIGTDGYGSRDAQALDLTETQRFTSGLIRARTPANLEQIAFRPARERLTFETGASGMTVVNGLGATVTTLVYRVGAQVYTLTDPMPPGGRGALRAGALPPLTVVPSGLPLSSRFQQLLLNQPDGSYLAILDRSPFLEPGVSGVIEQASFHVVLGWPEGQP